MSRFQLSKYAHIGARKTVRELMEAHLVGERNTWKQITRYQSQLEQLTSIAITVPGIIGQ